MATKKPTSAFDNLRKNRGSNIKKLVAEAAKLGKKDYDDPRYWKPTIDASKNGSATIRFMPVSPKDTLPWIRIFSHSFKNPKNGLWMIENCHTTIGQACPVCEYNSELWNSGSEAKKNIARSQKRRERFICNVLVVDDPAKPENNGKVFLYSFGKKIFEKIEEAMSPEFEDEIAIDPFDFWDGANFKLRIRDYEGFVNYDKSKFEDPSPLSDDDEKLQQIYEQLHFLEEEVAADKFKTYDEVSQRLQKVIGTSSSSSMMSTGDTATAEQSKKVTNTVMGKIKEEVSFEDDDIDFSEKATDTTEDDDYTEDDDEIEKLKKLIAEE